MKQPIHIGIAEDHDLVRQGLVAMLKEHEGLNVLFDVSNGKELLQHLKLSKPHIILLDIEMPVLSGKDVLVKIRHRYPKLKIIVISAYFQDSFIIEYIKKGAHCFLAKNSGIDKLVDAIHTVHEKGAYFDNHISMLLARELASPGLYEVQDPGLTEREITILKYICANKANREIASILDLSQRTVEWHRNNVMRKTACKNIASLVAYAIKHHHITIV